MRPTPEADVSEFLARATLPMSMPEIADECVMSIHTIHDVMRRLRRAGKVQAVAVPRQPRRTGGPRPEFWKWVG